MRPRCGRRQTRAPGKGTSLKLNHIVVGGRQTRRTLPAGDGQIPCKWRLLMRRPCRRNYLQITPNGADSSQKVNKCDVVGQLKHRDKYHPKRDNLYINVERICNLDYICFLSAFGLSGRPRELNNINGNNNNNSRVTLVYLMVDVLFTIRREFRVFLASFGIIIIIIFLFFLTPKKCSSFSHDAASLI